MNGHQPNDDELQRIREQKILEMRRKLEESRNVRVLPITDDTFQEVLAAHPHICIDFWAEWCGPCQRIAPIIEELAHECAGKITFCKCNVDDNPRIARSFAISAIPTLIMFFQGQLAGRITGAYPKELIRKKIVSAFE